MKRFVMTLALAITLLGFIGGSVSAQVINDGPAVDESTQTNSSVSSCGFPQNAEELFSYAAEDAVWPEIGQQPLQLIDTIPAGTYRVYADSFDPHSTKNDPTQYDERWQFWAYGTDQTTPIYYSSYTDDLPDDQDRNTTLLTQYVTFKEDVTGLRYVHYAFTKGLEIDQFNGTRYDDLTSEQKGMVAWNSVLPDCISFEKVEPIACTLSTTVTGRSVTASFSFENPNELSLSPQIDPGDGTKPYVGTSMEHTYIANGTYKLTASLYLNGESIADCSRSVTVAPSGTVVLGATTTTPSDATTTGAIAQVLGATTLANTGVNSTTYIATGVALLAVTTPLLALSIAAAKRQ
jgi:hypothetical protein